MSLLTKQDEKIKHFCLFLLKNEEKDDSTASIFARITVEQSRKAFFTNRIIDKSDWESSKQRAKAKSKDGLIINNQLQSVRQAIFEAHRIIYDQGIFATADLVYDKIMEKDEQNHCFIQFYKEFLDKKKHSDGVETTTEICKKYERLLRKFENFVYIKYNKSTTIEFKTFNAETAKAFFNYLKGACKLSHNTAIKQMQLFKCVIKAALNNGHFPFDPFFEVKYKFKDNARPYLVYEELKRITELTNIPPRFELVADGKLL